jgi:hypothetical protein
MAPSPVIALLLQLLDEGFDKKAWHGPNLRGGLRRVDASTAAFRPQPGRHNIWEQTLHAAYWKYTVRRRITGENRGSFPVKGSNWFVRPDRAVHAEDWDEAWKADLALLDEVHRTLRAAVVAFDPRQLDTVPRGAKLPTGVVIRSIAMHDVYHAGQIALLKKLAKTTG